MIKAINTFLDKIKKPEIMVNNDRVATKNIREIAEGESFLVIDIRSDQLPIIEYRNTHFILFGTDSLKLEKGKTYLKSL